MCDTYYLLYISFVFIYCCRIIRSNNVGTIFAYSPQDRNFGNSQKYKPNRVLSNKFVVSTHFVPNTTDQTTLGLQQFRGTVRKRHGFMQQHTQAARRDAEPVECDSMRRPRHFDPEFGSSGIAFEENEHLLSDLRLVYLSRIPQELDASE